MTNDKRLTTNNQQTNKPITMKSKGKILFLETTHPVIREELEKAGFECDYFQDHSRNDFLRILKDYDGIVVRSMVVDRVMIEAASGLRFIGRVGSGMDNINVVYAESRGIKCINSPEGSRDAVGEHTLGLLVSMMRGILKSDKEIRKLSWGREANRGTELKGKTIGIIGYGNMGSAFAEKLMGFGVKVIAYDKYKKHYSNDLVIETDLETLFRECDVCSLHVPLTDETRYLVDDEFIKRFQKNIYLINTSRGMVVNTNDLVTNLESGKITGVGLDVIEYEDLSFEGLELEKLPEAFHYLAASENVVLTPHIAGYTYESKYKLAKVLSDKIRDLF